jgi:hypothetical protein
LAGSAREIIAIDQAAFQTLFIGRLPWTGGTRLDRAIYSLRHSQHHLGQINAELRRKGVSRGEWA